MTRRFLAALVTAAASLGVAAPALAQDYHGDEYDNTYSYEPAPAPQRHVQYSGGPDDYDYNYNYNHDYDYGYAEQQAARRERLIAVHAAEHQRLEFQQQRLLRQGFGPGTSYYRRWQVRVERHNARFHPQRPSRPQHPHRWQGNVRVRVRF